MKHFVLVLTAYMFLVSIAPNMQGTQLLNIPMLVSHYNQFHKAQGMTFQEFLIEHYAKCNSDKDKDEEHKKLPFKSIVSVGSVFLIHPEQKVISPITQVDNFNAENESFFAFQDCYLRTNYFSIWHPPQLV